MSPGEKRRRRAKREREQAAYAAALAALPPHASCSTCKHVDRVHNAPRLACLLESDFHGNLIVSPDHKCPDWKRDDTLLHTGPAVMFMRCGGREPTHAATTIRISETEQE